MRTAILGVLEFNSKSSIGTCQLMVVLSCHVVIIF